MGNFSSTWIMKNATETKSISQNSNKIIQKKFKIFKKKNQTFLSLYLQKNHWPPSPNCASWFFVNPAAWISAVCFYIILWFQKNIVKKKMGSKNFSTKTLHVYCIVKKCAFFYNYISVFQREIKKIIHKVSDF